MFSELASKTNLQNSPSATAKSILLLRSPQQLLQTAFHRFLTFSAIPFSFKFRNSVWLVPSAAYSSSDTFPFPPCLRIASYHALHLNFSFAPMYHIRLPHAPSTTDTLRPPVQPAEQATCKLYNTASIIHCTFSLALGLLWTTCINHLLLTSHIPSLH